MSIDIAMSLLKRLEFFDVFDTEQLRIILFAAENRVLRPNERLYSKGDPAHEAYLVQSGLVMLVDETSESDPALAGPGTLIGEMALLVETERMTDAVAREATSLLIIPRKLILRLLSEYPDSAALLRQKIAARTASLKDSLEAFLENSNELVDEIM
jgi:CRP-like cAMP-binding protein